MNRYYDALGLQSWEPRLSSSSLDIVPSTSAWDCLKNTVAACTACSLHQGRTQTVFGVGNQQADLMIIGEAPGTNEDLAGEPFVGRAGQLLTAMIKSIGFARNDIYIANILKCRPPENRDPLQEEVKSCTPFLDQQIALVQPKLILAVGRIASHYLLKTKSSLESLRGQTYHYGKDEIPLIVTYHPAYLLRSPSDKKKAFLDLRFVQQTLHEQNGVTPHGRISAPTEQTL